MKLNRRILGIFTVLMLTWAGGFHVLPAMVAKDNPPLACQLLGGTWNIWDGWRCG